MCMCDNMIQKILDKQREEMKYESKLFDEWSKKRILECPLSKDLLDVLIEESDKLNKPIEDEFKDKFWFYEDIFIDVQFDDLTKQEYFDRIMKSNEKATQEELEKAFDWLLENEIPILNEPYISKIGEKYYF